MNPKYEKLCAEILKTREKLTTLQTRLRDMERQKTEMENSEIVAAFRSTNVSPEELSAYIRAFHREGATSTPAPAKPPATPSTTNISEEDDHEEE